MNFKLKNSLSGRNFFILGIVFVVVTLLSIYILSSLITQISEKSNSTNALRSFIKKQEVLALEFSRFLEIEKEIKQIIKISTPNNLSNNLNVLSTIHANQNLVKNNWFQINNGKIEFRTSNKNADLRTDISDFIAKNGDKDKFNCILKDGQNIFWRIYFKANAANGEVVRYGYDIDLKALRFYFSTVDQLAENYAFVFDKEGTILYHPEIKFIKQNVFKITDVIPSDTIFVPKIDFTKKIGLSEYLKLDIVRYTKRLNVAGTNWYVCVNFPENIANEDVDAIKKYASLIYFITTAILLIFFYLFALFTRKSFQEKEDLAKEKNKLSLENEKIKKEKALIQLHQLKEQINPHFLFNSLNSLYMLIESNTGVARKFTLNLSKIYRYLINPPEQNIVTLKEELLFIEKYIFLQQTRYKDEFNFTITIEDNSVLSKKVPYLAFQIAIENAIKHNIASDENPLNITITIQENKVVITNNLNEKQNFGKESKFGHKYLQSIYNYYSKTDFETFKRDGFFVCILPLIE
ncbi:sensor histidine kinase [Flavobacterium sp. AJR]|uniref:sensor histidine kinase n=1 Tax=Flavobacterium sp. AJR TaxID=1979369 RepID=UPI000A3D6795|nr:histidine kinase [Flavobacterium sp. AJR]OUL62390.1 histidine kinase [Flavobacterium sp. AJR]